MRYKILFLFPFLFLFFFHPTYLALAQSKQITLEDIWKKGTFRLKDVPGFNAMNDGLRYTQKDADSAHICINTYKLESGEKEKTLFDNYKQLYNGKILNVDDYRFSANEDKIMLFTESENIYRRSVLYHTYVLDLVTGNITEVDTAKVLHATFSPDGRKVAFVKNNNLYIKWLETTKHLEDGKVVAITKDGLKNNIINGNCDWVYEEEFSFSRAFEWSDDGKYLAYYRFDESQVPEYTMAKYTGLYPEQYKYKYPKAGEKNSVIQIKIYNTESKKTVEADLGKETDQYIPRIKWTAKPGELCIYRLNRLQNHLELLAADAATGATHTILTEDNKYYIDINDEIYFLPDRKHLVLSSERNKYNHLYSYEMETKKWRDLTPGDFDVDALIGVDTSNNMIYYTAGRPTPLQRSFYVVSLDGTVSSNPLPAVGYHSIIPCKGFKFFLDRFTSLNSLPVYNLVDAKGKTIRTLEDNHEAATKFKEYALGKTRFMKVKGAGGDLDAWMITPPDFDSTKRYPVLMYQYSGPGSQEVGDRFPLGNYWWHQMLAEKGYIIVCTDGTGTGMRGEEFKKKTYLQLGKYESDDQIAAARYLGTLPYVDKDRIGIWGWSFGGFMSATCILKGNDVFKTAIAVAPVTNWRYYDNIYTERYMRTPAENEKGYDENAPEKIADKLKGKFLFIHGTADDNVHFQNSVMLANALIKAGKDYDSEFYPDKAHGIGGADTRLHLYRRMTDFILKNL